jgi:hypothetical protein
VRKDLPCGDKTRRGGAQDTVRITVLKQLALDHPAWSVADIIDHLNGIDSAKPTFSLESTPECSESEESTKAGEKKCDARDVDDSYENSINPISMQFTQPGTFSRILY